MKLDIENSQFFMRSRLDRPVAGKSAIPISSEIRFFEPKTTDELVFFSKNPEFRKKRSREGQKIINFLLEPAKEISKVSRNYQLLIFQIHVR